jgi:hypothetical protein
MVVMDITRMEGDRVCVGGYLDDGTPIRPIVGRAGPNERWLQPTRGVQIEPFSILELRVNRAPRNLLAPHTEDRAVPASGHRLLGTLPDAERRTWLESSSSPSVRAIFGAEVHANTEGEWGRYVLAGEGSRSLGTVRASDVCAVGFQQRPGRGRWDYRLRFRDETQEEFQFAVVDLAFRRQLDGLRHGGQPPDRAAATVLHSLQRQTVYLRIGLARGWDRYPDRCYLQITGVYGFPAEGAIPLSAVPATAQP